MAVGVVEVSKRGALSCNAMYGPAKQAQYDFFTKREMRRPSLIFSVIVLE